MLKFLNLFYEKKTFSILYICRCEACLCSVLGSVGPACDPASGQCSCRPGYTGHKCNICPDGGGERHGGCGQGPWGFIYMVSYAKLFAKKIHNLCHLLFVSDSHVPYYTVKKVINFPLPIREVTNQTLPGREYTVFAGNN